MILTYTYRLYPRAGQLDSLDAMLHAYRELYNAALEERREAWKRQHVSIHYRDQANQLKEIRELRPDLARFNYSAAQQVLRRLDKAFRAFFRRIASGEKPGYPRFQSRSRFSSVSFVFGDGATWQGNRLKIQGVGGLKVKWHRPLPDGAKVKQVVLKRKLDWWYASFQVELPDPTPVEHSGAPVGVDVGLSNLAALSTGELVKAPQHSREAERRLRLQQRRVSRRRKFSGGWHKAQKQVAKTHAHTASQRQDLAHKLSMRLAQEFSRIAVEDLNVKGLAKSNLAKSVHDAGWSQLLSMLEFKVQKTGSQLVKVDPRFTSQVCSACGSVVKKDLSVRVHECPDCGFSLDRDVNAARNILTRALSTLGRSVTESTWPVLSTACVSVEAARL